MNKSYKSVWNESTGSWVAVSELATGRSKSKRAKTALSKAILTQIAVGGMSLAGAGVAMADDTVKSGTNATVNIADGVAIGLNSEVDADTLNPSKIGGVAIGDSAYAIGSGVAVGQNSQAGSDSLAFGSGANATNGGTAIGANSYSINNGGVAIGQAASATGAGALALGMNSSATASGSVALGQDSVATGVNTVSVGNATTQRKVTNMAAGTAATDAVNVGQLTAAGLIVNSSGVAQNAFVAYDSTAKTGVTFGNGTVGAQLHQVVAGTAATDAVNVGQLTAAGLIVNSSGVAQNAFVAYDSTAKTGVTFGNGTVGAQLHQVVAGTADTDATNVAQLKALGATIGTSGTVTNSFVSYSTTAKDLVTLLGASGTKISNVAAGTINSTSKDAVNGSQLYNAEASVAAVLGGSAGVNADGTIKAPTYTVNGKTYTTLDTALTAAAASGSGTVTGNAVSYDGSGQTSVTLGSGTVGAQIHQVVAGTTGTDAVNLAQLTSATNGLAGAVANSKFIGISSVMSGSQAQASGDNAVAIGGNAFASANNALAFGTNSRAVGDGSVAIGFGSTTTSAQNNTVSFGSVSTQRRLINVAAGVADTDAVNLGQVNDLIKAGSTSGVQTVLKSSSTLLSSSNSSGSSGLLGASSGLLGAVTPITLDQVIAVGPTNKLGSIEAIGTDSVSIGLNTHSTATNSVAIGSNINSTGTNSVAMGYGAIANGTNADAFGSNANVVSDGGLALGNSASVDVNSPNGIAVGSNAYSGSTNAIGMGNTAQAVGAQAIVVGNTSTSLGAGSVLIGNNSNSTTAATGSFVLGSNVTVSGANSYVLGSNIKSASGTNSVVLGNGSDGTQSNVISVGAKGTERKIVNVAAGTTTTDAVNLGKMTTAISTAIGTASPSANSVVYDSSAQDKVTLGKAGTPVTVSNVAAGVASTDAVNVKQLTDAGLTIGTSGVVTNAFVAYDSTAKTGVTLGNGTVGAQIHQVAAGTTTTDAVNLGQLAAAGIIVNSSGVVQNAFVAYDSTAKTGVTLGNGTVGAQIHKLVAGTTATDAVNLGQLTAAGLIVNSSGVAQNAFVAYDSTAKTGVTLGNGTVGAQIHQVVAGTTGTDAVNLAQLTAAGIVVNSSGVVQNAFVAYDSTAKTGVTLGNGTVGAQIHQVVAGVADTDATNVAQLKALGATIGTSGTVTNAFVAYTGTTKDLVSLLGTSGTKISNVAAGTLSATSMDAVNGSQLYNVGSTTAAALGGGATMGADGKIKAPAYTVAGSTYTDVGNALDAVAALAAGGSADAVVYDSSTHDKLTLGKAGKPVTVGNVAAGVANTDAVNVKQLTDAGLIVNSSGVAQNAFVAYDSTAKTGVTLGNGTVGAQIHQVAAGTTTTDAVNLGQLAAAGIIVNSSGVVQNAFVAYDSTAKTGVTLGNGTVGAQIHKLVAGTTATDAVNLGQLTAAGLIVNSSGVAQNAFVAYDSTAKTGVTLGNGTVGAQIHQVVAGTADTDATNVAQLKALGAQIGTSGTVTNSFVSYSGTTTDLVSFLGTAGTKLSNVAAGTLSATSMDAVNGSQLFNVGSTTAAALGGGATMGADGKIKAPAYTIAGSTYTDVGNALTAVAGLATVGSVNAVLYDSTAHTKVTLGGTSSTTPVIVSNVADGVANNDAVNVEQLNAATSSSKILVDSLKYVRFGASSAATAQASGTDGIAIGGNAFSNATGALAFGLNSRAIGANSVALGTGSLASADNTVSVGTQFNQRRIVNVAAGTDSGDAVNLGQVESLITAATTSSTVVKSTQKVAATRLGTNADGSASTVFALSDVMGVGTTDKLDQVETSGTDSIAIGLNTKANASNTVAIGTNVSVAADSAVGVGSGIIANGVGATAIGVQASVIADRALAIGNQADGEAVDAIAIGTSAAVGGAGVSGIAIGTKSAVSGAGTIVLGSNNVASGTNAVLVGNNIANATGNNSVTLGYGSDGSQSNVVSVGAKGTERKIVNVAAGTTTTDAVNLGQLNTAIANVSGGGSSLVSQDTTSKDLLVGSTVDGTHVNFANSTGAARELLNVAAGTADTSAVNLSQLKPVVAGLGGGATVDAAGKVTGPTYTIQNSTFNNAGDAFTKVDGSLSSLTSQVAAITADSGGLGLVAQNASTRNITVGATTDGGVVDVTGTAGTRRLTGLTAGVVTGSSTDAINGSQLAATSQSIATAIGGGSMMNTDGTIIQPTFSVGGTSVHNVGDAISNLDTRVTSNTNDLTTLQTTVNNITASGGVATPNAVAYDTSAHDKLTLGAVGTTTTLTNLTAGDISSADSTDAVTGGQLYATNQDVAALQNSVKNISTTGSTVIGINGADGAAGTAGAAGANGADAIAMGDNASASGDHAIVIGGGASGTGDGVIAIGGNSNATGKDSIAIGNGATAPANNAVALGANSVADRDNSVSMGSQGNERQITNVAAGTQGTDAVNLNQMNSAVGGIARKAYSGIAAATALTMIPDVDANKTLSLGIGGGTFQGYAATAIGGTARITQNIKVRVGAGWSAAGTTVGAGASYQW